MRGASQKQQRWLIAIITVTAAAIGAAALIVGLGGGPSAASSSPPAPAAPPATAAITAPPTTLASPPVPTPKPSTPVPSPTTVPVAPGPPHFDTPQAAMIYLASAWNRNDIVALSHVTTPAARANLLAMHKEAVNLRLNHCAARPVGDYVCFFDHDYPVGATDTSPGGGHSVFLVGPARTPGWYMTVFEGCG